MVMGDMRMNLDPNNREMTNIATVAGEVTLFRAVIARAFHDALNRRGINGETGDSEAREARVLREEAREWLLTNSVDFRRICQWGLLEPEAVRDSAVRAIESCDAGASRVAA
jgi:hypothetical protein